MQDEDPALLSSNVNSWLKKSDAQRMLRVLDGRARAFLSKRYLRIDHLQIAATVLPIIGGIKEARVESCQITDNRMYIKVVNPRLQQEVRPGDVVQSGIIISNSEIKLLQNINDTLLDNCLIRVNDHFIIEPLWVEAYYFHSGKFEDYNTHQKPQQKTILKRHISILH